MKSSATVWYCNQCGDSFYSQPEAVGHCRSKHQSKNAKPRIYGKCGDCGAWLTAAEVVAHRCDEAEARVRAASMANRWWLIGFLAAMAVACFAAAIVGRMMK